jgi:glycosyltransferase involved in cell wall biosynthesis
LSDNLLIGLLILSASIQLLYYFFVYSRVIFFKKIETGMVEIPVSVIIAGKNEESNIPIFLPKVLNQEYPSFEVIFVNDCSSDSSSSLLSELNQKNEHLKIITIDQSDVKTGKKNAITRGIEASKYEHLVFTDADTYPASDKWLSELMSRYNRETEIVLGYGAYERRQGFLNKLVRFDTMFIALQYFSYTIIGVPYMGTGRNMSYLKALFQKQSGFSKHSHLLSGDDDLFINQAANSKNTKLVLKPCSFTYSIPKMTLHEFLKQKARHLTTGIHYRKIHQFLLGVENISRLMFWILSFIVLFFINLEAGTLILLIVVSIKYFIISIFALKVKERGFLIYTPLFDFLIPILNLNVYIRSCFVKVKEWK